MRSNLVVCANIVKGERKGKQKTQFFIRLIRAIRPMSLIGQMRLARRPEMPSA